MKMALLNRNQILEAQDIKTEIVEVPEWGGEVTVKLLTGTERDQFESSVIDDKGKFKKDNIRAKLVLKCVVDEQGNPLFQPADLEALGAKSAAALDRVFSVAQKLNRMGAQDLEELAKN
jgi:hypothetical protein